MHSGGLFIVECQSVAFTEAVHPSTTSRSTAEHDAAVPARRILLYSRALGDVAQLGERRVRNAKVGSSILLVSTKESASA